MRLLSFLTLSLSMSYCANFEWNLLTDRQKAIAIRIYELAKPYDLSHTMIAIAWQESLLGEIPINLADNTSCGVHHIHLDTYAWIHDKKNTVNARNLHCSMLIEDLELSTSTAISVFKYYKKFFRNDYNSAIRAYNTGQGRSTKKGEEYLAHIKNHLSKIIALDKKNPHIFREHLPQKSITVSQE